MRSVSVLCLFLCIFGINAHKILTIFPAASYSHFTLGYTLSKELAARGHDVTLLASFPDAEPAKDLRILHMTRVLEEFQKMFVKMDLFAFGDSPLVFKIPEVASMGAKMVEGTLADEVVQNLLKNGEKFDAVIIEYFYTHALLSLAHHFEAQPIIFSAIGPATWINSLVGNPDIPSYITQAWLKFPIHNDFCKRVHNMLVYIYQLLYDNLFAYPKQNEILQNDVSYSEPVPKLSNMIEIGGFHVQPPKKLPEDLQKILDGAKNGVVYFSLGSALKSKNLSPTLRDGILRTFSKLKETVLWKYEDESLSTPSNVIVRKWFPQSDLLAHPNIKLFITHGGQLSTIESLYRGVPIIGIPVFGDQKLNMANAASKGYGVLIDFPNFSEETLSRALKEVLNNPLYLQNVKRGSQILRDQQTSPADRAEFWIDYVIRHKGAKHLRPASLELTWHQHISLDVVVFLTAATVVLFTIFYKIIKWLLRKNKILTIFPGPTYRHYELGYTLSKALAVRGHDVTLIASFSDEKPVKNLRILRLTTIFGEFENVFRKMDFFAFGNTPFIFKIPQIAYRGATMVQGTLADEVVQNLLKKGEKFDAVIVELFYTHGLLSLAHHFGAQPIIFSALGPGAFTNSLVGNPDIPSYITQGWLNPPIHKVFYKRVHNTLVYIYQTLYDNFILYPEQNKIVQKYLPNSPSIYDLIYNISLILHNTDVSYSEPVPKLSNMIEIGGYHIESPKELPEDLQNILDEAKNGVIYFSLGSELKSENLPPTLCRSILRTFSRLKQTVLWKYDGHTIRTPSNVITRKWFPQSDLLAHPNIKLFITEGGQLSVIESLYRGVPMIGIPVLGHQRTNIGNAARRGYGVLIDFLDFSEETLQRALEEVLHNPIYSQNVKRGSQILRDQQTSPADRAEFWIDYVIRHKGARHLRPASLELTWYQHISLDVVLFLTAITVVLFMIFYRTIKWLLCRNLRAL
ncbi:hypothetical protein Trydic_g18066 [Trypoxylus dichotomus]